MTPLFFRPPTLLHSSLSWLTDNINAIFGFQRLRARVLFVILSKKDAMDKVWLAPSLTCILSAWKRAFARWEMTPAELGGCERLHC